MSTKESPKSPPPSKPVELPEDAKPMPIPTTSAGP